MKKKLILRLSITLLLLVVLSGLFIWQYERMRRVIYVIPPGVGAGLARFEAPQEIILTLGWQDTLVIENQDDVVHTFGPFMIMPHTTFSKRFTHPVTYEGECTLHRSGQMKLVAKPLFGEP
jgi:hypothetical protein